MFKEFKEFAIKGNMLDMAVGIIIGAAFGTVVRSLVDDIIMPVVSTIFGTPDFSNLFVILQMPGNSAEVNMESIESVREAGGVALGYGLFINSIIAFLLVAWVLYLVVKNMNKLQRKREEEVSEEPIEDPVGPTTEELLIEIRDLLAKR